MAAVTCDTTTCVRRNRMSSPSMPLKKAKKCWDRERTRVQVQVPVFRGNHPGILVMYVLSCHLASTRIVSGMLSYLDHLGRKGPAAASSPPTHAHALERCMKRGIRLRGGKQCSPAESCTLSHGEFPFFLSSGGRSYHVSGYAPRCTDCRILMYSNCARAEVAQYKTCDTYKARD